MRDKIYYSSPHHVQVSQRAKRPMTSTGNRAHESESQMLVSQYMSTHGLKNVETTPANFRDMKNSPRRPQTSGGFNDNIYLTQQHYQINQREPNINGYPYQYQGSQSQAMNRQLLYSA